VVALSKRARLLEGYVRRPQPQKRPTTQIAGALQEQPGALGSIVVIEASHLCMTTSGIQNPGSITFTSADPTPKTNAPGRRS
jgi:GTP cyclohydrolase I